MVCAQIQIFCLFIESKAIEGERRSTYWCMPAVLNSLFFLSLLLTFFSFVLLPFLPNTYFWVMVFFLESLIIVIFKSSFQCTARGLLYRVCRDWYLLFQPLTAFVWCGRPCRPLTGHQYVQPPPLTCADCVAPLCQTKKFILFVCLPWLFYLLQCVCSLSLSIPHGMHLVVLTHLYFFWVACHPNRIFPPIEPEQEHQNKFFPSPYRQTIPSLTSNP